MKRLLIGIGIVVITSVLATILLSPSRMVTQSTAEIVDGKEGTASKTATTSAVTAFESTVGKNVGTRKSQNSFSYADALKHSHSYLQFAKSTIAAAKAGDPNAEYYLGKALAFCDETYAMFFTRRGQRLTLDEALVNASQVHRSNSFTQSIYDRCHDLEDQRASGVGEFGTGKDWVEQAANAGLPAAQATVALTTMSQVMLQQSFMKGSSAPTAESVVDAPVDQLAESRAALLTAVQSEDPQAIWYMGAAQGALNQSFDDKVKNQLAWWLVSCQRGFDCSSDADWLQLDCQDETLCSHGIDGEDYIRNAAAASWPDVEQRARDINAKLDAKQWNELGLGS